MEAFVGQTNTTTNNVNNDNNNQIEAAVSSSIPIKQESESDAIYIIESDDDNQHVKVEQESINETEAATLDTIQMPSNCIRNNAGNEPGSSIDRGVCKMKSKKVQRRTKIKSSTTCEVCKSHFQSRNALVYHRQIHLDNLNHFCRTCLQSNFSSYFYRNIHEERCKYVRYECYICKMSLRPANSYSRSH